MFLLKNVKALNGLLCADVPLRNYSLTHSNKRLYPSHTRAATVLRLYCDQIFDQIALDRSKVSLRSHYGLNVVAVGRTSRRMVVLVAVRNFGMFKIPYCDFSIAVQSVCCLSALVQLVLWSQYTIFQRGSPYSRCFNCARSIGSHDCTATMRSQIVRMNCNVVTQPNKNLKTNRP